MNSRSFFQIQDVPDLSLGLAPLLHAISSPWRARSMTPAPSLGDLLFPPPPRKSRHMAGEVFYGHFDLKCRVTILPLCWFNLLHHSANHHLKWSSQYIIYYLFLPLEYRDERDKSASLVEFTSAGATEDDPEMSGWSLYYKHEHCQHQLH